MGALEPVQRLFGDRIGVQSGGVDALDAPHGLVPMQAAGAPKLRVHRPDFTQPFGQVPCRAVSGVASLVDSGAIHCAPRLASHPGKGVVRLQKDVEQALSWGRLLNGAQILNRFLRWLWCNFRLACFHSFAHPPCQHLLPHPTPGFHPATCCGPRWPWRWSPLRSRRWPGWSRARWACCLTPWSRL